MDRWLRTPFLIALATAGLVVAALYFAEPVLAPLAIAAFLSVLLGAAVKRVERAGFGRARLGRVGAVLVVAVGISAAFAGMGWIFATEGADFARELPEYRRSLLAKVQAPIARLEATARKVRNLTTQAAEERSRQEEVVDLEPELMSLVADWAGSVASLAATAGIVVVLLIFLLLEHDDLRDRLLRVAGRSQLRLTGSTLREASERITRYVRALAVLNCGHGLAVGVGLALLGVPGALLFGLLAALLRFIPYVGPLIAACAPLLVSIAVFDGWTMVLWVGLLLGSLEIVSNNFLEPWLFGTSVGLSPFAVVLSTLFWAWLWGPIGLVLATPLTVCLVVMGRHVPGLDTLAILLGDSQALHSFERLYERLLGRDIESATALVAEESRGLNAVELWDRTLIPSLRMLERDRQARVLEGDDLAAAREAFELWIGELPEPPALEPREAQSLRVVCAPAGPFADEIMSAALARILASRGIAAHSTRRLLPWELLGTIATGGASVVCLSAFDTPTITIRHLVKRLKSTGAGANLVMGVWGLEADRLTQLRAALASEAGIDLATTLEQAIEILIGRATLAPQQGVKAIA